MMSKVLSYILTWYDIKTDLLMCMYNVYVWLGNILKMNKCVILFSLTWLNEM